MPEYLRFSQLRPAGVPFCRSKINAMVDAGEFPRPVAYGLQRAWLASDIVAWAKDFRAAKRSPA
jgi:predicted DNA-binding transcriptional regulator AlpA